MPEGDTIHRAARAMTKAFVGQHVIGFETSIPALRKAHMIGKMITQIDAHGKYLFVHFEKNDTLVSHMKMTGSWHIYRPGDSWKKPRHQAKVIFQTESWIAVCFNAPIVRWATALELKRIRSSLGIDILSDDFDMEVAYHNLRSIHTWPIGEALLHQATISGIGNIYKSESLFMCGLHPQQKVLEIPEETLKHLVERARKLMQQNVPAHKAERRTSTHMSSRVWVYRRQGLPCLKCETIIQMFRQGGAQATRITLPRSTYYCPSCQTLTNASINK